MNLARLLLSLWLLGSAPLLWATSVQPDVEFLGQPPMLSSFANPATRIAMPEGDWQRVQLPHTLAKRTLGYTSERVQSSYYRLTVPPSEQPLFLYLPRWQTVGQLAVYGDGRLLWRSSGDRVWNGFNTPLWLALDPLDGQPRPRQLLLRLDSVEGLGGGISSLWLGSEEELLSSYRLRHTLQITLPAATGVAVLALGLFALGIWSRRRHEAIYGLFFITSLLYCLRIVHYLGPLDTDMIDASWFGWITVNALGWLVAITQSFILRLCRQQLRWLERSLMGFMLAATLLTLPFWQSAEHIGALASASYLGGGLMYLFSVPLVIVAAHRSDSRLARWLAWGGLLALAVGIHDWLLQNYLLSLDALYLVPYWQIAFCLLFGIIMGQRYVASIGGLERSREELALRLAEREAELHASHQQLREIERRDVLARERQRLLQDMHDGLGSTLTGALRMAQRGGDAADLEQALHECMDELKLTIDSIAPMDADLALLLATLRFRLQPRLEASGMRLRWQVGELPRLPWLTPGNVLHVLRILQEVVTNILKHAGATEIVMKTCLDAQGIHVQVADDGKGFVPADTPSVRGHGIGNIHSRAKALGGWVVWSVEGRTHGSEFTLWLPLNQ